MSDKVKRIVIAAIGVVLGIIFIVLGATVGVKIDNPVKNTPDNKYDYNSEDYEIEGVISYDTEKTVSVSYDGWTYYKYYNRSGGQVYIKTDKDVYIKLMQEDGTEIKSSTHVYSYDPENLGYLYYQTFYIIGIKAYYFSTNSVSVKIY